MFKLYGFVFSVILTWSSATDTCITPSSLQSHCISLQDCEPLLYAFQQNPVPDGFANYIKLSRCGDDSNGPKVCCGPLGSLETLSRFSSTDETSTNFETVIYDLPSAPADKDDSYLDTEECGPDSAVDRIYGGMETNLDEFPWLALLMYETESKRKEHGCGGSLINHRYVMTAAHCLNPPNIAGKLTSVRLGEYDTGSEKDCVDVDCADPVQEILVEAFYRHPGYINTKKINLDDIGLVRLSKRAEYNDFVKPVCLVSKGNSEYMPKTACVVAGWGYTLNGTQSQRKLKVGVRIYDTSRCFQKYREGFHLNLTPNQLCAGGELNEDSCHGDSGGPLMRIIEGDVWEAIGIVSFGYHCGQKDWPAVYTSVAAYIDWIRDKLKETNV